MVLADTAFLYKDEPQDCSGLSSVGVETTTTYLVRLQAYSMADL